jgi:TPR repeat protein
MTVNQNHHDEDMLSLLKSKAEAGDSLAQYELATRLANGDLGERDHEASFNWYMKAALKGHVDAMWCAGLQLVQGVGVERALEAGLHLINLAASHSCYDAIIFLADSYHMGENGIPIDRRKSKHLYSLAERVKAIDAAP